jgi:D-threonate/D-erythronate kinase
MFAEAGWRVELLLQPQRHRVPEGNSRAQDGSAPLVLAVATGCRAAGDEQAAEHTAAAVHQLWRSGIDRLYLKIDSTVRGSVAGQIDGALSAWQAAHSHPVAVVCPAFPALGRTVEDGIVLVHGMPVAASPAGQDPVTPRRESRLDVIIPGSVGRASPDRASADRGPGTDVKINYDARTDADLSRVAAVVDQAGPAAIAVGSGGLAGALADRWRQPESPEPSGTGGSGPVLLAVSSLHPVARQQLAALREDLDLRRAVHVITTVDVEENGSAAQIAADLADRVVQELTARHYRALVLVGGDGAAAVLRSLRAQRISLTSPITTGIPAGVIVGGPADGTHLVTKSGGFGDHRTLITIVRRLTPDLPSKKDS